MNGADFKDNFYTVRARTVVIRKFKRQIMMAAATAALQSFIFGSSCGSFGYTGLLVTWACLAALAKLATWA